MQDLTGTMGRLQASTWMGGCALFGVGLVDTSLLYRILGFRLAPPVVGRVLNLTHLAPVTSSKLLQTYFQEGM